MTSRCSLGRTWTLPPRGLLRLPTSRRDFEVVQAPARLRRWVARLPIRAEQLKLGLLMRAARQLLGERAFDAVIGTDTRRTSGVAPFNTYTIPGSSFRGPSRTFAGFIGYRPAGDLPLRDDSSARGLHRASQKESDSCELQVCRRRDSVRPRGRSSRGAPAGPGGFPLVPWDKRQNRVVGIGGFRRDKRWRDAFDVVKQVRERGHDIGLSLIGYRQSPPDWLNELIELQREHASWFKLHVDVPRTELVQISRRQNLAFTACARSTSGCCRRAGTGRLHSLCSRFRRPAGDRGRRGGATLSFNC